MVRNVSGNATARGPANGGEMLGCDEAASVLAVPPAVLRGWAQRLSFPENVGTPDAPRFRRSEVEALRAALDRTHSVEGAIRAARERLGGGGAPSP
jgi:hypothetical protein